MKQEIKKKVERNIKLYALFQIFREPLFWGPVLISYIINVGQMSLAELYFMEAVVVWLMVVAEIYSSAWADLLGRKKVLILGTVMIIISMIIFAIASNPLHIWISNTIIMVALAIISGADSAFFYDSLKEVGREDEHLSLNSKILGKRFFIAALGCIAAGYLYNINPRLPMFLGIPGLFIALIATLNFYEPKRLSKAKHNEHFDLMKMSVIFVANHKMIKWIIGYIAIMAISTKIWFFSYNPYFELVELDTVYYGWIFAGLNLIAWLSSRYASEIKERFREKTLIIAMGLFATIPMFLMASFVAKLSILFIIFDNFLRGFRPAFFSTFINVHLDSKNRATVLSIKSAALAIISGLSLWIFSMLLGAYSLSQSLQVTAIVLFVFVIFGVLKYHKIFVDDKKIQGHKIQTN